MNHGPALSRGRAGRPSIPSAPYGSRMPDRPSSDAQRTTKGSETATLFDWKKETPLEAAFNDFDRKNLRVYGLFKRFTFQVIDAGHKHYSADAICHRIRWHTSIDTRGDDFKINNNYTAFYARKFMKDHPEHDGFFSTRATRAA